MGCGCNKKPKKSSVRLNSNQAKVIKQHNIVDLHINSKFDQELIDLFEKQLKREFIEFRTVIDNPVYNRTYPYYTVRGAIKCIARIINLRRKGEL